MLKITRLGTETARDYFKEEFAAASNSYFAEDGAVKGRWHRQLPEELGLSGPVAEQHYMNLIDGKHPLTGQQFIQHRDTKLTRDGKESAHRPGWDMMFSLPKSWAIAAVVGGDKRIYDIAEKANAALLDAFQPYVQAKGGGNKLPINTGQWIVATFRHETSRPVEGYAAPCIHFHNVLMNVTQDDTRKFRAVETGELYKAKSYAVQVAYNVLANEGRKLGYHIDFTDDDYRAPEIRGFSREYIEHESPRNELINEHLEANGLTASRITNQIANLASREEKLHLPPEEIIRMQVEHGKPFAHELVTVQQATEHGPVRIERPMTPGRAVALATRKLSERHATFEHFELAREALKFVQGAVGKESIEAEIRKQLVELGQLVTVHHYRDYAPGARYTTAETLTIERDTVQRVLAVQNTVAPILPNADLSQFKELTDNPKRQQILKDFLSTTDQVTGLNGTAGSAKSTAAGILKKLAESQGYRVKGLAPTGTATDSLKEKGISSATLQMHLSRSREQDPQAHRKTLYIVDEASLASTRNINSFLKTLAPADHVILVGDDDPNWKKVGQHTSVEAGRVFKLLQEAGMKTAHFNRVYRQKTPELKEVVLHLRHGETQQAIDKLDAQGRIHEYANVHERFAALARFRAESPDEILVVSPDNDSRLKLSSIIRNELQTQGVTQKSVIEIPILIPRDATTADTSRAASYRIGDTIHYRKGNKEAKAQARSYATVIGRDIDGNRITVKTQQGEEVTYNPARASGVSLYESRPTSFAVGEHIQFTTGNRDLGVSTRDTATIIELDRKGNAKVRLDRNGQNRRFNLKDHRHIDHAYVMTSHSSQSKTVHTIAVHVDTSDPRLRSLLNDVFAYVAASRGQYDIQIFTDDKSRLVNVLSRQNEEQIALAPEQIAQLRETMGQTAQMPLLDHRKDINTGYAINQ